jgi:hypothetical protein
MQVYKTLFYFQYMTLIEGLQEDLGLTYLSPNKTFYPQSVISNLPFSGNERY